MPSKAALEVLQLLKTNHNVLVSGPPGTGKSRLLNEVAELFEQLPKAGVPAHVPGAVVPIPPDLVVATPEVAAVLPSPDCAERKVYKTAFHQGTKYRDFVRGLVPTTGAGEPPFRIMDGTLYEASEWARQPDHASLVVIDEINRGPAVQVFGDTIVTIEADKRLDPGGSIVGTTQGIRILADDGSLTDWHMPYATYLLAAMNQADTSVEPLDVAFQRRWQPYKLLPDSGTLFDGLGVDPVAPIPDAPVTSQDVLHAAAAAWERVNDRISLGRGADYQIGHGVFLEGGVPPTGSVDDALAFIAGPWKKIRAHIDEVFFGHTRGIAAVLNIGVEGHPLKLEDRFFAGDPVVRIKEPAGADLYKILRAVAAPDAG